MDGLLVDSEPLWRKAEVNIFNAHGIPINLEMCDEVMGLRIDEVVSYWFDKFGKEQKTVPDIVKEIIREVGSLLQTEGQALPGAIELVQSAHAKGWKTAIVSSSYMELIEIFADKFDLKPVLTDLFSAEHCTWGKPHPEVFIQAVNSLEVETNKVWVFEDSLHGLVAAKAAKMKCCVVPNAYNMGAPGFALADLQLRSLEDVDLEKLEKELV